MRTPSLPATARVLPPDAVTRTDILGIVMEWKLRERETDHQYCLLDMRIPPGAMVPIHHHAPAETFHITEGEIEFGLGHESAIIWSRVTAGDVVHAPGWAYHGYRNVGHAPCRILLTCGAGLEAFFDECGIPIPGDGIPAFTEPAPEDVARVIELSAKHGSYFLPMDRY